MTLREDANKIIQDSIQAAMPDSAVGRALERCSFGSGRLLLTAAGKGGWQMAKAAYGSRTASSLPSMTMPKAPLETFGSLRPDIPSQMKTPSVPPRPPSTW